MKPKGPKPDSFRTAIEGRIRFVRGQKIILDRDMAEIYGVSARTVNLALNCDVQHLPDELVFRLTHEESRSLKLPIATLKETERNSKHLPFAFTDRGLLMAENVLRSQRATNKHGDPIRQLVAALRQLADNFRKTDEFEAEERRRKRKEGRVRIRQIKLQMSSAAINDGLNDLKPGIIPARWWWLQSLEQWELFREEPWAQGYELLHRSPEFHPSLGGSILGPHFTPVPPESDPTFRSWPNLTRAERERFKFDFNRPLGKLGFLVGGGVWVGNNVVVFNCLWSSKRNRALIEASLRHPAPFAGGSNTVLLRKRKQPTRATIPNDFYIRSKNKFKTWKPIDESSPEWISLPLPKKGTDSEGRTRRLNSNDVVTAFETFIRNSPEDYKEYRASMRTKTGRLDHPQPRTLAFGLMCFDSVLASKAMTELAKWLAAETQIPTDFRLTAKVREKTDDQYLRTLRHSLKKVKTLLRHARMVKH